MQLVEKKNIAQFRFDLLNQFPNLSHGVLLRHGGVSLKPFNSLNLALDTKGNKPDLLQNLSMIKSVIGVHDIVWAKQVHQTKIIPISSKNIKSPFVCDGFLTQEKNVALLIKHADCQAALFYDPIKNVIGNVHAGWKGLVLNIYEKMVQKMQTFYGCNPKDIYVCISPSLGPKSAEFIHYKKELPKSFWAFKDAKNYFDLWAIAEMQLLNAKIKKEHIEIAGIDTFVNTKDFFSYRREKVTGRNGTYIYLK